MATSVWKGHLTFGLVSIPVKLYRAARAEKVGFRQVHETTGTRVRQALFLDTQPPPSASLMRTLPSEPLVRPTRSASKATEAPEKTIPFPTPVEVNRADLAKGYEYEPGRYLVLSKDEMDAITPPTAYEMQILEFVKLAEVDPIYFETSYYVAPDRAGEHACALLFQALRQSGFVAIARVAMHRREHVVIIRPGRTGIILHTMFYEAEIRREEECRTQSAPVSDKELELALLLVNSLAGPFDPLRYRDSYREKLDNLIAAKLKQLPPHEANTPVRAPVVNILDALQRSLQVTADKDSLEKTASRAVRPHRPREPRARQKAQADT